MNKPRPQNGRFVKLPKAALPTSQASPMQLPHGEQESHKPVPQRYPHASLDADDRRDHIHGSRHVGDREIEEVVQ